MNTTWPRLLRLHELARGAVTIALEASPNDCLIVAKELGLVSLGSLTARITAAPWFDGVELTGSFEARLEQVCGVTLDTFEQAVHGQFEIRAVPSGSPQAPGIDGPALDLDPEAPDAPDVLVNDTIDVSGYVVEHLALELDPFPRKPGATFEFEASDAEISPFAALKALRAPKG